MIRTKTIEQKLCDCCQMECYDSCIECAKDLCSRCRIEFPIRYGFQGGDIYYCPGCYKSLTLKPDPLFAACLQRRIHMDEHHSMKSSFEDLMETFDTRIAQLKHSKQRTTTS